MSAKSNSLINPDNRSRAVKMEQHVVRKILAAVLAATCSFGAFAANVAPTVSITAPAANATFVAPAAMTLSATAADSDGTITAVAFYKGTTLLGNVTTAPYNYSWANVAAGTYSITTRATDDLGAVTISAPLTVTVNPNVLPSVSLTAPAANANFIAPATVALSATAADTDGTITKVAYYRDSTLIGSATVAPYAFNWTNAAAGTYSVTARATDDKGGVTISSPVSVVVKANVLPTVSLTKPVANASFAAPGVVALAVNAADSDGTLTKVAYFQGATQVAVSTVAPFAVNWSNVAIGDYSITAKAYDDKGGITTSAAVPISVKANVAPTVSLTTSASSNDLVGPGAAIPLNAVAADSDGSVTKVGFYNGTLLVGTVTTAPFNFTWSGVTVGTYTVTAKATDDKGVVTTSAPISVTVKANVAPTISIAAPVSPATFYGPGTLTLAANAADNDGTITKVVYYNGATVLGTVTQAPFSFAWTNPTLGSYSITAKATDNKGAVTTSAALALTVKTAPVPTVSVTSPVQNAKFVAPAAFSITAAASITGDSISKVEFISSGNLIGTANTAPYTINLNNVAAGNYEVSAKATGALGGTATSALVNFSAVANVAPQIDLSTNQSSQTAPAVVTLNATATDSDGTIAKVEFYNGATLLGTATQEPYSFVWNDVAAGTYTLTARATDNLGLVKTSPASVITVGVASAPSTTRVYYIHTDQINTAREISNATGGKVWESDPDPFGANLPNENPLEQGAVSYNLRFPGQYHDKETGLHYNYNRDYDPQTGRYVQSDPIGLKGGINTYGYVTANPVSLVDPDGLQQVSYCFGTIRTYQHAYVCSGDSCSGLMPLSGLNTFVHGEGVVLPEKKNPDQCINKDPPKKCDKAIYEACVAGHVSNTGVRHGYGIATYNCVSWAREVIQQCMALACSSSK
jgi:RHS repeat-associated protein